MARKPVVWYVDDLPSNLDSFVREHGEVFTVRTFSRPEEVLESLKTTPDALLCDIFFYDSVESAEEMEETVQAKALELRFFGEEIGASKDLS